MAQKSLNIEKLERMWDKIRKIVNKFVEERKNQKKLNNKNNNLVSI